MIALGPLAVVLVWLVGAVVVGRVVDPRQARRAATWTASVAVGVSAVAMALPEAPLAGPVSAGAGAVGCLVISLAGLLVAAMSPVEGAAPVLVARLLTVACGLLAFRYAVVEAALLALGTYLAWSGDRLFARYQFPGALLLIVGAVLPGPAGTVLLAAGVVIRMAAFPAHAWFPRFVDRAPMGVVVAYQAAPVVLLEPSTVVLTVIGAVTALTAAVFAAASDDGRRGLAYLLITANALVITGASWLVGTLAAAGLAMTVGALAARRESLSVHDGGDFAATPRLAVAYLVFGLSLAGFPLLAGFAEGHHLPHAVATPIAVVVVIALSVAGIAVLRGFLGLFTRRRVVDGERDLTPLENYAVVVTMAVLVVAGLAPGLLSLVT
ncbi:hypothetical protein [Actinokineospora cianjurensis]|uniref:NADH:quinone oxidoreductase/Mrp antiporter membrane subunit domain-containing protein n=1 Tax=Actinokineospora cianjurensis TaxID=585224 RepID=A0A421B9Z3_9PSEU|nr:hypothetical protein [Actinokineospora cianjurensis]RLK61138.1 hypothetical protein CLV68_1653 [Actinokineospora cianjurensis]